MSDEESPDADLFRTFDGEDGKLRHANNECGGLIVGERWRMFCLRCLPHELFDGASPDLWLYVLENPDLLARVVDWLKKKADI